MLQLFIITVLIIYGIHASTRADMIFEKIEDYVYNKNIKLAKVLFNCTPCMASVYGTITFSWLVFFLETWQAVIFWPAWVFSIAGFNFILNKLLNK